ncbi:MAG: hypothetical protein RLO51_13450 [Thalassobaculum sp.]|uniref:hypothetical protein n=1 Tax=Thalassobaculum sp. TaxID=2022740 RepID=UPI0032EBC8AA
MALVLELALATAAAGLGWLLARALLRLSALEHPGSGGAIGFRQVAGTNALGLLLIAVFVAGSGLMIDALCRVAVAVG